MSRTIHASSGAPVRFCSISGKDSPVASRSSGRQINTDRVDTISRSKSLEYLHYTKFPPGCTEKSLKIYIPKPIENW
jgi:hypothetical protein